MKYKGFVCRPEWGGRGYQAIVMFKTGNDLIQGRSVVEVYDQFVQLVNSKD